MAQEIAETPSFEWVVNAAVTLANVAATKLELGSGADAQLAIDALAGLLNSVGPRLQQAESPLRQTLAQLQLAFAQRLAPPPGGGGSG
jgi:ABC-type transporter Mla subunit MlaD